ncbi:hypothetical protein MIND_00281700 [Mycena indigotica]|uniref:Uncharacterized protein n=1 Tax=Mycena indigotica TaxID=2126181 RepID=A0A8H6WBI9_9AGAR|nr:uncharacterized protein MIND_00281700 [Mycena indigotica]KAF7312674.1 hypothetical protein MIND_00281700 [Mycena indigotica]
MSSVDILILGAGWTSTFLVPLCKKSDITFASTTRSGASSTIKFEFQPDSEDEEPYRLLPDATTVLITFPITLRGASERLVKLYLATRHTLTPATGFIQLGATTRISLIVPAQNSVASAVTTNILDRHSPISLTGRANAEEELLGLHSRGVASTTVLNLAGLWGGQRIPRNWLGRVASTKEALAAKGSLHLIHGEDVARAILAIHNDFATAAGERWLLTDGRVYDWWDLASAWRAGSAPPEDAPAIWVRELMKEAGVKVLPRDKADLGRVLDSSEFWDTFGLSPVHARVSS